MAKINETANNNSVLSKEQKESLKNALKNSDRADSFINLLEHFLSEHLKNIEKNFIKYERMNKSTTDYVLIDAAKNAAEKLTECLEQIERSKKAKLRLQPAFQNEFEHPSFKHYAPKDVVKKISHACDITLEGQSPMGKVINDDWITSLEPEFKGKNVTTAIEKYSLMSIEQTERIIPVGAKLKKNPRDTDLFFEIASIILNTSNPTKMINKYFDGK
jgi:hypothetical protein